MDIGSAPISPKEFSYVMNLEKTPVLHLTVRRPTFPECKKYLKIERYFNHLSLQWVNRWKTILYTKACQAVIDTNKTNRFFVPWQCTLDYTITYWEPPLFSVRIEAIENTQSGKPTHIHQGETWDCASGYPRTLRSFYPSSFKFWRKDLLQQIKNQAETSLHSGESLLDPNCAQIMARTFDPDRFYLTEQGIALFYPLYILGPYAEGIPTFTIPFPKLS